MPKHEEWIDYPESIPLELFTFRVPKNATLRVEAPDLGRVVLSPGA